MWILMAALAVLVGAQIFAGESDMFAERSWTKCKESFVQQMFSDTCTPVRGIAIQPSDGGVSGSASGGSSGGVSGGDSGSSLPRMVPADQGTDGVDRVDRGS
jgi:outer membrane lipoprotein SlyB